MIIIDFQRSSHSNAIKAEKAALEKREHANMLENRFRAIEDKLEKLEEGQNKWNLFSQSQSQSESKKKKEEVGKRWYWF